MQIAEAYFYYKTNPNLSKAKNSILNAHRSHNYAKNSELWFRS